jgi:crotonobetainyl-CoA:carnitine CoA-transferase CaiB-like acyl-CoA transferase
MATQTQEMQDQIEMHIHKLFSMYTKEELYNEALKRGIMLCPVNTSKDIFENVQLKDREFWVDINHPELSASIVYPGVFAKLSETPLNISRCAPLIGEHNLEIYQGELGLSSSKLNDLLHARII